MKSTDLETSFSEKIKAGILTAWQEGHGGHAEKAHLLQGDDGIALLIPEALYQAEIELSRDTIRGSHLLEEYLRTLVDSISSELIPLIENFAGQEVAEIIPLIDIRAGWMIAFYRFKLRKKAGES
ncbi:MAG: hypothetical protein P8Y72_02415 [Anaerolineales bacterium]|jgi:hypothetical protein